MATTLSSPFHARCQAPRQLFLHVVLEGLDPIFLLQEDLRIVLPSLWTEEVVNMGV